MFPFLPSFSHLPNQSQIEGSNCSAPQQVMSSNQCLTNLSNTGSNSSHQFPCSSCAHQNPQNFSQLRINPRVPVPFNGSNNHLSNLNGNFAPMPNTHFPNVANNHVQLQNSHVGRPFLGSVPHELAQASGQFFSLNTLHNLNSVMTSPHCGLLHNFPQNLNQLAPIQQRGQLFAHNQNRPMQPHVYASMPGGNFNPHNLPQHINQAAGFPQSQFLQNPVNPAQVLPYSVRPCSSPLLGGSHQGVQTLGSQKSTFLMNQQLGLMNSGEVAPQNTQDQHVFIPTTTGQNTSLPSLTNGPVQKQQTQKDLQPTSHQWSQGNNATDGGNNISNISQRNHLNNNFTRNHHESGKRESANPRFQKSKFQPRENAKGNFRSFNGKGGKGHHNVGARKSNVANSTNQTRMGCQRSLPLNYTEQEILQWREERRKNHPLRSNGEKKSADKQTHSEDIDKDAKKRRQQLKEILAKQAELGVEVAELPLNYLTDSENQVCEKEEEPNMHNKKGRFQNKYGKRGKRGNSNRFAKKQKLGGEGSFTKPDMNKRKPTLLQKLLSADIKRDKSHLLQVFRFMVMNSFFKDWPEKPLEFPLITVKDGNCRSEIIEDKSSPLQGDGNDAVDDDDDDENENDVKAEDIREIDSIQETIEKSEGEEGEITD